MQKSNETTISDDSSQSSRGANLTTEELEPLPDDNREAIEVEINHIDNEIDSLMDEDLSDLDNIESDLK